MSTSTVTPTKGLEGIVAATSSICYIDGDAGILAYRGIDIPRPFPPFRLMTRKPRKWTTMRMFARRSA